ncbi:Uncharacterised protein [Kytococcus sedentarius]|nr:Uncharacterised protein [Kytococcus sedentarius]
MATHHPARSGDVGPVAPGGQLSPTGAVAQQPGHVPSRCREQARSGQRFRAHDRLVPPLHEVRGDGADPDVVLHRRAQRVIDRPPLPGGNEAHRLTRLYRGRDVLAHCGRVAQAADHDGPPPVVEGRDEGRPVGRGQHETLHGITGQEGCGREGGEIRHPGSGRLEAPDRQHRVALRGEGPRPVVAPAERIHLHPPVHRDGDRGGEAEDVHHHGDVSVHCPRTQEPPSRADRVALLAQDILEIVLPHQPTRWARTGSPASTPPAAPPSRRIWGMNSSGFGCQGSAAR